MVVRPLIENEKPHPHEPFHFQSCATALAHLEAAWAYLVGPSGRVSVLCRCQPEMALIQEDHTVRRLVPRKRTCGTRLRRVHAKRGRFREQRRAHPLLPPLTRPLIGSCGLFVDRLSARLAMRPIRGRTLNQDKV